jgi:hypothetical protein
VPRALDLRERRVVLAFFEQHRDRLVDLDALRALRNNDFPDAALVDRLVFHCRLVGLDLGDDVAGMDLVALFLEPAGEIAFGHRRRQRRHADLDGHELSPANLQCPKRSWLSPDLIRGLARPSAREWRKIPGSSPGMTYR